ncbi:MAG: spore germination protein [Clostridiales bacterium]|nr:spore germination protein [Clostridiales bacterium]
MSRKKEATADIFDSADTIFSENRKISPRQIRRAMTLELFGISSLILPPFLAGESGILGLAAMAVGAAGAYAVVCLWDCLSEKYRSFGWSKTDDGEKQSAKEKRGVRGGFVRKLFFMLVAIGFLEIAAYVLYLLTAVLRDQLLNSRYEAAILITLTAAAVFGLWKGLEPRIRIYEVLFWLLMVPLAIGLIIAAVRVHPVYWVHTVFSWKGFGRSCYASFLFFSVSSLFLLFRPRCNPPGRAKQSVRTSLILTLALDAAVYLILLGIFQDKLLSQLEYPVILLMAVIKLPGGFFERHDALMVGIWFFCLFALLDSVLYYASEALRSVCGQSEKEKAGTGRVMAVSCVCGAAVFAAAAVLLRSEALAQVWAGMLLFVTGPAMLAAAGLSFLPAGKQASKKIRRRV